MTTMVASAPAAGTGTRELGNIGAVSGFSQTLQEGTAAGILLVIGFATLLEDIVELEFEMPQVLPVLQKQVRPRLVRSHELLDIERVLC